METVADQPIENPDELLTLTMSRVQWKMARMMLLSGRDELCMDYVNHNQHDLGCVQMAVRILQQVDALLACSGRLLEFPMKAPFPETLRD